MVLLSFENEGFRMQRIFELNASLNTQSCENYSQMELLIFFNHGIKLYFVEVKIANQPLHTSVTWTLRVVYSNKK